MSVFRYKAIFIVCAPRTGSTWLSRLMGDHTDLVLATPYNLKAGHAAEESEFFISTLPMTPFKSEIQRRHFTHLKFRTMVEAHGKKGFVEKTPRHVFCKDAIHRAFPDAYIIHLVRNGLDVLASLKEFDYLYGKNYAPWGPTRPDDWRKVDEIRGHRIDRAMMNRWVIHTEHALSFRKTFPRYYELRYEDFVANPIEELGKVFDFCGLSHQEKTLLKEYDPDAPSVHGVHAKIKVVGHPDRWREVLREDEVSFFKCSSGYMMQQLGYEVSF